MSDTFTGTGIAGATGRYCNKNQQGLKQGVCQDDPESFQITCSLVFSSVKHKPRKLQVYHIVVGFLLAV